MAEKPEKPAETVADILDEMRRDLENLETNKVGREIRKVPKKWQHLTDDGGNFKPLYDQDFDSAAQEWLENCRKWEAGENPDRTEWERKRVNGNIIGNGQAPRLTESITGPPFYPKKQSVFRFTKPSAKAPRFPRCLKAKKNW